MFYRQIIVSGLIVNAFFRQKGRYFNRMGAFKGENIFAISVKVIAVEIDPLIGRGEFLVIVFADIVSHLPNIYGIQSK